MNDDEKPVFTETEVRNLVDKERDECAKIAKVYWLTYPFAEIADADVVCGLCEGIAEVILKRKQP